MATQLFKKEVKIMWKLNPSSFEQMNSKVLGDMTRRFGSSEKAVNSLLSKQKMLELLMPNLVSFSKTDLGWQKAIANYWNRLQLDIPANGKTLLLDFEFDINDAHDDRKQYITILKTENKLKTTDDLVKFITLNTPIEEWWKYGNPIKAADYLIYIFSFNYRDVANSVNDITKPSAFIRFYLHDDSVVKLLNKAKTDKKVEAQGVYIEIIKSETSKETILNLLTILEPNNISEILKQSDGDRQIRLFDFIHSGDADLFINTAKDENLMIRAHIERLINANIIKRLSNSDIIVDSEEPSLIIGNTMNLAITWFSNIEQNKPKISEYSSRLNAIK